MAVTNDKQKTSSDNEESSDSSNKDNGNKNKAKPSKNIASAAAALGKVLQGGKKSAPSSPSSPNVHVGSPGQKSETRMQENQDSPSKLNHVRFSFFCFISLLHEMNLIRYR